MNKRIICKPAFTLVIVLAFCNGLISQNSKNQSADYASLIEQAPSAFEENKGQFTNEKGEYQDWLYYRFRAGNADLYLTQKGVSYIFYKHEHKHASVSGQANPHQNDVLEMARVDVELLNARIDKRFVIEENPIITKINYFNASNPRGIKDVNQYRKITFKDVYPGIDWVWYLSDKSKTNPVKYDFVVHPGANPSLIKLKYHWADVELKNKNSLLVKTPLSQLQEGKAVSFNAGKPIATSYNLHNKVISFNIEDYDKNETLVIDPPLNLIWGSYFGGNAWEKLTDVSNTIDINGNVFVTSNTWSSNSFPTQNPGGGAYFQVAYAGPAAGIQGKGGDACIFKFSNIGALIWCTYYGGSDNDNGCSITTDATGNVYVVGSTLSSNFPLQNLGGAYNQAVYQGGSNASGEGGDAFILKFSNNGNLLWSTFYGGSLNDVARGVMTDAGGNVYVTGWTESANFPLNNPGGGAYYQPTSGGNKDAFIVKFSNTGQQLWSTYYGGNGSDIGHYLHVSGSHVFICGESSSTNFPTQNPGGGAYFQSANAGGIDAFILKTTTAGVNVWSTLYGGSATDIARGITVSNAGAVFIGGQTSSTNLPTLNPGGGAFFQGTKAGAAGTFDAFFARFSFTGTHMWGTYFGGSSNDDGCAVVTDNCGNMYATGNTFSTDLPTQNPGAGAFFVGTKLASDDVYFCAFNTSNGLIWSTYNGTTGFDEKGTSLKVDNNGNLFIVGYWCFYSNSNAYMSFPGAYDKQNTGADDFFIAKLNIADCAASSYSVFICYGSSTVISIPNIDNLSNPSYSIQPGGQVQGSPNFTVSPSVNTTYTLYITGTNINNAVVTNSIQVFALVLPAPIAQPLVHNGTCANPSNSVVIGVTFTPAVSQNYTVNWSPFPQNFSTINTATASGLTPGPNSATITAQSGCTTVVNFTVAPIPLPADFIVINPSNNWTITCNNPSVLLTTSVTNGVILSYTWFPLCSNTLTGSSYNFTTACTGQVIGTSSTGCVMSQTYTIYEDITSPTIAITPTLQNITCNTAPACFTLTSNMHPNVTTNWYQVVGTSTMYVGVPQGTLNIFCPTSPGIYWGEAVNNITGCKSTKSVQVTASVGVPQMTITSSTNFTIGCSTTSITSLQVTSVQTSPVPNTPVNYAFVPPPGTATPVFTNNPNYNNLVVPGTYVVYVQDLTNNCITHQSVTIIQNTIPPPIEIIQPLSRLTCKDPCMVLTGISSNQNTTLSWTVPAIPSNSINPTPNYTVCIDPTKSNANNSITVVGTYTFGAVDNNNLCRSSKTVTIIQDIRVPAFNISALTNSVINCKNEDVVIVPISTATWIPPQLVPTYVWYTPNGGITPGSQFNTTACGAHTAIATSVVNGCTASATYTVACDFAPPALVATEPFILDCNPNPTVVITPSITGNTSGYSYQWTVPPGAITSALTNSWLTTNMPGDYHVEVLNNNNGCEAHIGIAVIEGNIKASFIPNPSKGYAPLAVTFSNTSTTSTGATSIISTWGYGNGTVTQTLMNTQLTNALYEAPGTYSVILKVKKGTCEDTAMRIIVVEMPSKLEIPNVFTPNGDKANDVFRLIGSSLKEIHIIIYDRWGNRVYEVTSNTGNFAWDGTNLQGKECPDGTYFYILKATGMDDKEFEHKGNVSLFR